MNITVLIDMDDTLLSNPFDQFMPAYFKLLGATLADKVNPKQMLGQLMKSTDDMIKNNDFRSTLEKSFARHFYSELGLNQEETLTTLNRFYDTDFQSLKSITATRPEAISFVKACLDKGYTLAVATNPLFPKSAMLSRLEWGELNRYPFALITAYESFHFAKPNPAYFAEILAQLGWPEGPVVMIGNSFSDDIAPAAALGIKTFYLSEKAAEDNSIPFGSFEDCLAWIDNDVRRQEFSLTFSEVDSLLAMLRATPAALDTILKQCDPKLVSLRPQKNEWSIQEVISHLRDVDAEVNLPRFESILSNTVKFIPAIDTDAWAEQRNYRNDRLQEALEKYFSARESLIQLITPLKKVDLERTVNHSVFGPTRLGELVKFILIHDQNHIRQIKKNLQLLSKTG